LHRNEGWPAHHRSTKFNEVVIEAMRTRSTIHFSIIIFILLQFNSVALGSGSGRADEAEKVKFFEGKVRPLLVEHCYGCHSDEAEARGALKAGLKVDSLADLRKGGDSGSRSV
jgi:hypothetical protein